MRDAVYNQDVSSFAIMFRPVGEGASSIVSNWFTIKGLENERVIQGEVAHSNGYGGPMTTLSLDCVPGAAQPMSSECAIWQNFVYALDAGVIVSLPRENEPAPPILLLPTFGRTIYDRWTTDIGNLPIDQFEFSGCSR
jgi:hypothetical protein